LPAEFVRFGYILETVIWLFVQAPISILLDPDIENMPLLYYWRSDNYFRDLDMGAGYNLNQANPLMHQIGIGDSLWAITRNHQGRYVLAAELVCKAKTENPPHFRYGRYRIWGDIVSSRYFQVDDQPSVEQVVRALSCTSNARILGHAFQGHSAVKRLSLEDHRILTRLSLGLPLEARARILPEERLEASLLLGDVYAVEQLIAQEPHGVAEARRQYLYTQAPARNSNLAVELQAIYEGQCQICLWRPREIYVHDLCQAHHIHWLSRGGADDLDNLVLVCPNHHTAIHRIDAPLNYKGLVFDFGDHQEEIQLNRHLQAV
jgi:hypothetical protein